MSIVRSGAPLVVILSMCNFLAANQKICWYNCWYNYFMKILNTYYSMSYVYYSMPARAPFLNRIASLFWFWLSADGCGEVIVRSDDTDHAFADDHGVHDGAEIGFLRCGFAV